MQGMEIAVAVGLVALVSLLVWRSRRSVARRLGALTTRLSGGDLEFDGRGGLENALDSLQRAVDGAASTANASGAGSDRLTEVLEHVFEGLVICDETGEVVHRNQRAAEYIGTRHSEAIAAESVRRLLHEALAGTSSTQTLDLFGPPRRTLTITATPLGNERGQVGAVAVIEDVSERRRLEAIRRDFVANISHELKTPIGALGLLAETLAAEEDPATIRRFVERMQVESFRVARIIDDLLDLSRIEAEEAPRRELVHLHLVIAEAVERVRTMAQHKGITLEVHEPDAKLTVLGDRRQLVSAVHNLLENALKYSEKGSTVRLEVAAAVDGTTDVVVSDEGIGIPSRDLERIFERFYRVDHGRGRDSGGTGLGLAIVRHIANNHGGDVVVSSQEGRGSTFTLRLPASVRSRSLPSNADAR